MIRSEIWTASGGGYAGKPRPVVIVQSDRFDTDSVTVCPFTTDPTEAPLMRLDIAPTAANGLAEISRLMIDKPTTVAHGTLGRRIGRLADKDMLRLNRAMLIFLGLADYPSASPSRPPNSRSATA